MKSPIAFVIRRPRRLAVLKCLDEYDRPSSIERQVDLTSRTIQRYIADFESMGAITCGDSEYELTALGKLLITECDSILTLQRSISDAAEFLEQFTEPIPVPPTEVMNKCDITAYCETDPLCAVAEFKKQLSVASDTVSSIAVGTPGCEVPSAAISCASSNSDSVILLEESIKAESSLVERYSSQLMPTSVLVSPSVCSLVVCDERNFPAYNISGEIPAMLSWCGEVFKVITGRDTPIVGATDSTCRPD